VEPSVHQAKETFDAFLVMIRPFGFLAVDPQTKKEMADTMADAKIEIIRARCLQLETVVLRTCVKSRTPQKRLPMVLAEYTTETKQCGLKAMLGWATHDGRSVP
jgi:hypothetical protein